MWRRGEEGWGRGHLATNYCVHAVHIVNLDSTRNKLYLRQKKKKLFPLKLWMYPHPLTYSSRHPVPQFALTSRDRTPRWWVTNPLPSSLYPHVTLCHDVRNHPSINPFSLKLSCTACSPRPHPPLTLGNYRTNDEWMMSRLEKRCGNRI